MVSFLPDLTEEEQALLMTIQQTKQQLLLEIQVITYEINSNLLENSFIKATEDAEPEECSCHFIHFFSSINKYFQFS